MPAHRKPTTVLELNGAFDRNPGRRKARQNEPKPSKLLGLPPSYFTETEKALWAELERKAPPGVLTLSDEWLMEMTVALMAKLRDRVIKGGEYAQLQICMRSMGMTPADRSRVHSSEVKEEPDDAWAEIARNLGVPRQSRQ